MTVRDGSYVTAYALAPAAWCALSLAGARDAAETVAIVAFYLACALAFVARPERARDPEPSSRRATLRSVIACVALAIVSFVVGARWLVFADGVPVLRHDWTWPAARFELHRYFDFQTADWNRAGFGAPKAYPTIYPIYWFASTLASYASSHAVLCVVFLAGAASAGAGVAFLCVACGLGGPVCAFVAVAYASAPFFVDEFVAGHFPNVVAYDLLPVVAALGFLGSRRRGAAVAWGLAAGLTIAISIAQIQYALFDAIALALALRAGDAGVRRGAIVFASAFGVAIAAHGQSFAHLVSAVPHGVEPDVVNATHEWFRQLSSSTLAALAQSGYIGGYADSLALLGQPARVALPSALAWVVVGYAAWRGGRAAALFVPLVLIGVACSTGVFGPFAAVKAALVQFRPLVAFREFYNFQSLTTLGIVGCCAIVLHEVRRRRAAAGPASAAVVLGALVALPFLGGGTERLLHLRREGADEYHVREMLAGLNRPDERIAMLPLVQPLRQDGYDYAGSETYQSEFSGVPVAQEWAPDAQFATADALLRSKAPGAGIRLLGRLGVRYLVLRDDVVSGLPQYANVGLFAGDWSTREYYKRIEALPTLHLRYRGTHLSAYELETFVSPLAAARRVVTCDGRTSLDVLAAAYVRSQTCEAPGVSRDVPLRASIERSDARFAWINAHYLFPAGPLFAQYGDRGVATLGPNVFGVRFEAREGDDLAVACIATSGLSASVDGAAFRPLGCADASDTVLRYAVVPHALHARNAVLVANLGGPATIARVVAGANLNATALSRQETWVPEADRSAGPIYRRIAPGTLAGFVDAAAPRDLVLSDAYDDRWGIATDGGPRVAARVANAGESAFRLSPGTHAFTLSFEPSKMDTILGIVQGCTWAVAFVGLAALVAAAAIRSRSRA